LSVEKAKRGENKAPEFIFMNQRYNAVGKLKTLFKNILMKTSDGEKIPEPDHTMVNNWWVFERVVVWIVETSR
jgi:hypothetical protein